jgi:lipopolysaccharide export system protein LptA
VARLRFLPFAIGAILAPAPIAQAEILGVGGGEGVSLEAEQLDIDILAGEATLTGKVTLSKGDLVVNARASICASTTRRTSRGPRGPAG